MWEWTAAGRGALFARAGKWSLQSIRTRGKGRGSWEPNAPETTLVAWPKNGFELDRPEMPFPHQHHGAEHLLRLGAHLGIEAGGGAVVAAVEHRQLLADLILVHGRRHSAQFLR